MSEQQRRENGYGQAQNQQPIIVNVNNTNTNANNVGGMAYPYKNKWVALVLAVLFGAFGVHRFYVGKTGTGLIWLFTFGLCGIGWIADIVFILLGSFRDKAGYPLRA